MKTRLIATDGSIEYKATFFGTGIILSYATEGPWADKFKGKVCGKLEDSGNDLRITINDEIFMTLDYGQLERLRILLNLYCKNGPVYTTYKRVK